ncbi:MAG: nuclear transport factor 2 family protein [Acidobacteriota bacterium]|nr:nuclear transport factor 2 family protein [Acidobacteriota bacterium]
MKLVFALLATVQLLAQPPENSIRGVLQDQVAAWNRGDIASFMLAYEDSPRTTFIGKDIARGHKQVLERYRQRYPTAEKMGVLTFSDLDIRMLDARNAAVIGRFHLKRAPVAGGNADGIFSLVFQNTAAGWKIILDHTS